MPSIKGTASVADARAMSKAIRNTKFPKTFRKTVDLSKINRNVITEWIEKEITKILGFEDEIVSQTAANLFLPDDSANDGDVDPRRAQIDLAGFLGDEAAAVFAKDLWGMLLDAQTAQHGIPRRIMEEKKQELAKYKLEQQQQQKVKQQQSRQSHNNREASRRAEAARRQHDMAGPPPPHHNNRGRWERLSHHRDRDHERAHDNYHRRDRRVPNINHGGPPPPNRRDVDTMPTRAVSPTHPSEHHDEKDNRKKPPNNKNNNIPSSLPPDIPMEDEFGRAILPQRTFAPNDTKLENSIKSRWDKGHSSSPREREHEAAASGNDIQKNSQLSPIDNTKETEPVAEENSDEPTQGEVSHEAQKSANSVTAKDDRSSKSDSSSDEEDSSDRRRVKHRKKERKRHHRHRYSDDDDDDEVEHVDRESRKRRNKKSRRDKDNDRHGSTRNH